MIRPTRRTFPTRRRAGLDPEAHNTQVLQFSASFVGAAGVVPVGVNRSDSLFNYFLGDQSSWRSNVPGYEQVAYQGLYPGVDLLAQGLRSHLKYEFHVAAGADWSQIAVRYEGIEGLALAEDPGAPGLPPASWWTPRRRSTIRSTTWRAIEEAPG